MEMLTYLLDLWPVVLFCVAIGVTGTCLIGWLGSRLGPGRDVILPARSTPGDELITIRGGGHRGARR